MGQRNLITLKRELDQLSEGLCAQVFAVKGSWTQGLGDPSPSSPVPKPVPGASRSLQGWASSLCKVLKNRSAALNFRRRLHHLSAGFELPALCHKELLFPKERAWQDSSGNCWDHWSQERFYWEPNHSQNHSQGFNASFVSEFLNCAWHKNKSHFYQVLQSLWRILCVKDEAAALVTGKWRILTLNFCKARNSTLIPFQYHSKSPGVGFYRHHKNQLLLDVLNF